jgi:hypothetical protein
VPEFLKNRFKRVADTLPRSWTERRAAVGTFRELLLVAMLIASLFGIGLTGCQRQSEATTPQREASLFYAI